MSDEPKAAEPATENILLVYCGRRLGQDGKLFDFWYAVTPEQYEQGELPPHDSDSFRVYNGKNARKYLTGGVGMVYQVPQIVGGASIYAQDARYQGLWPDDEQRLKWQMEHRTATTCKDLQQKAKKDASADNFESLRPVRRQYARLISQNQRAALLAQVIAYITGGE